MDCDHAATNWGAQLEIRLRARWISDGYPPATHSRSDRTAKVIKIDAPYDSCEAHTSVYSHPVLVERVP